MVLLLWWILMWTSAMQDIWQGTLKGSFNPFPQRCHNTQVENHSYREMWIRERNDKGLGSFGLVSAVATLLGTPGFLFGSLSSSSVFLEIACPAWGFYFMSRDSHGRHKDSAAIDTSGNSVTNVWMLTLSQGLKDYTGVWVRLATKCVCDPNV